MKHRGVWPGLLAVLTVTLLAALLSATVWAAPSYDSQETVYYFVGELLNSARTDPYDMKRFDDLYPGYGSTEVIWGDCPSWFDPIIGPWQSGWDLPTEGFLFYGFDKQGNHQVTAEDKGEWTYYLHVAMYSPGNGTKPSRYITHKVTLIIQDEPHADCERTVRVRPGAELRGEAYVPPGSAEQPQDLAFPVPASAWERVTPEGGEETWGVHATTTIHSYPSGMKFNRGYDDDLHCALPGGGDKCDWYYTWTPKTAGEYVGYFHVRPTKGGGFFRPFTVKVRFIVSEITEEYDLWIDGKQLNNMNAEGAFYDAGGNIFRYAYEPLSKTLTLSGDHFVEGDSEKFLVSRVSPLTIRVDGYTRIILHKATVLELHGNTTVVGSGNLQINNHEAPVVEVCDGANLSVNCGRMSALSGTHGVLGSGGILSIHAAFWAGSGKGYPPAAITGFGSIEYNADVELKYPEGAVIRDGAVVDAEGDPVDYVGFAYYAPFDLWIDGTQVNERNKDDVLGDGEENRRFVFNSANDYLYIFLSAGSEYTGSGMEPIIKSAIPGLNICYCRDGTLKQPSWSMAPVIELSADARITRLITDDRDVEKLTLDCSEDSMAPCIQVTDCTLTVDGADIEAKGNWSAISGSGEKAELVVHNSRLRAAALNDYADGAVVWFKKGIVLKGSEVVTPAGGGVVWRESPSGYCIADSDKTIAANVEIDYAPEITVKWDIPRDALSCTVKGIRTTEELWIYAAFYDGNGRLCKVMTQTLRKDKAPYDQDFTFSPIPSSAWSAKVILTDRDRRPLAVCGEWYRTS